MAILFSDNKKQRIQYIDTIKGFACLFIFIGHFHYGFANNPVGELYFWQKCFYNIFRLFFNGTFAVSLFCIIAGYFVPWSIDSVYKFFRYSLLRYLRLALPLSFLCIFILLILKYYNPINSVNRFAAIFHNDWLTVRGNYSSLWDAIYASFFGILIKGESFFKLPVWMLRPMLIGQVALAAFILFYKKYSNANKYIKVLLFISLPVVSLLKISSCYTIIAVFAGGGINLLVKR